MPSKSVIATPLNSVWATDTPNKLNLNDDDTNQGIIYQSMVVSNQVNGALYKMSEALRYNSLTGGYYIPGQRYFKGQIVKMSVTEDVRYSPSIRFYECIEDNNGNGIIDTLPYNIVQAFNDFGGVRNYVVNPLDINAKNWRMLNGEESLMRDYIGSQIKDIKDWVTDEITKLRTDIATQLKNQQDQFNKQIADQQTWVTNALKSVTDQWKNLGTLTGGTFNLNFAGANNDFNCFILTLTADTNFGTCSWSGAKERSGCILINSGAGYIRQFFTNAYTTLSVNPFFPIPVNSGSGNKIWLFYKVHPTYGVCFTRG